MASPETIRACWIQYFVINEDADLALFAYSPDNHL